MESVQLIPLIAVQSKWRSINAKRVCINASDTKFKIFKSKRLKKKRLTSAN